ncbi:MAG TPA: ATP-binding protein [Puia sp.]|nr:ATP-binding protein [Puia sp.]
MSKFIDIGVERDHIEAQTKANGLTALSELIWNSLDADATEIHINYRPTSLGGYEYIQIKDNGHGLTYEKAQDVFSRLGGSEKKINNQSPGGRPYHGKEGKGRYKSLALGDLVEFRSIYQIKGQFSEFTAKIDRNQLSTTEFSDLVNLKKGKHNSSFEITITNVNSKNVEQAVTVTNRKELEERFASYWITYPNFRILFNGDELAFKSIIKHTDQESIVIDKDGTEYSFTIKIIEWNFDNKRKTYLCNTDGIPFLEVNIGLRSSSIPVSVFIQSDYIEKIQRDNTIDFWESDEIVSEAHKRSKNFTREYIRNRLHYYSKAFIDELKEKDIYPYKGDAENVVEVTKRQVFDIVALQLHEYLPSFNEQDDKGKKLTLALVSEALENDSKHLGKILTEVIGLPSDKREELSELLEITSLSNIIDTMTEIKNRLHFLNGLEAIIYNKDLRKGFKERKHLHKIIVNETWIFGEEYTYGVDDVTLKNVLKAYLKDAMGRADFEEVIDSEDNSELHTIPDVCLWQQYSMGSAGKENLVIELKKPSLDAGFAEKTQIESYAAKVASDRRFPKGKTRWKFILITKDIKSELSPYLKQTDRRYGHISQLDNCDVFILTWGDIISDAKIRLEFIKDKLNINLQENEQGLAYIKTKYRQYLPEGFADEPRVVSSGLVTVKNAQDIE